MIIVRLLVIRSGRADKETRDADGDTPLIKKVYARVDKTV